ncbi:MAG: hypothetical protein KDG89_11045 [Geminicoccaceae bacterium]|nr:hypothetical protein [Geminicoccaceae bacterium]
MLQHLGLAGRMERERQVHEGFEIAFGGRRHRIDLRGLTGRSVTVYGQTEITHDIYLAYVGLPLDWPFKAGTPQARPRHAPR